MEKSMHQGRDEKSGILMRKDTRILTEDEIMGKVGSRDFVAIEEMDEINMRLKYHSQLAHQGMYTIGVLTESTPIIISKRGKKFCIFKISDLVKYDLNRVKDVLTNTLAPMIEQGKCDKNEIPTLLKAFSRNGYK